MLLASKGLGTPSLMPGPAWAGLEVGKSLGFHHWFQSTCLSCLGLRVGWSPHLLCVRLRLPAVSELGASASAGGPGQGCQAWGKDGGNRWGSSVWLWVRVSCLLGREWPQVPWAEARSGIPVPEMGLVLPLVRTSSLNSVYAMGSSGWVDIQCALVFRGSACSRCSGSASSQDDSRVLGVLWLLT